MKRDRLCKHIFSRCDSMGEVCDGMRALRGKLNYLGMDVTPTKNTAGNALRFRLHYDDPFFYSDTENGKKRRRLPVLRYR